VSSTDAEIPTVEYRRGVYYLVLDAITSEERGRQHGVALRFPIRKALRQFKRWIRTNVGVDDPDETIADFAKTTPYLAAVREGAPDLLQELEGIAAGADVDLRELFVYQSFDEFFMHLIQSGALDLSTSGHCTTAGVYGRPGKPNLVGHNNDVPTYHEELVTVLHIKEPGTGHEMLQSTFAGQIGQNGVNSSGVAVGINTIADLPAGKGLPVSFHVRRILQTRSAEEAVRYLQGASFAQAMNYTIADRDSVVSVETWQDNAAVLDVFDGDFAVHTNHSLQPDGPRTFEMTSESGGGSLGFTFERLNFAQDVISQNAASIELDDFQEVFRTRPILVHPGKPTGRTLMSMVAEIPPEGSPTLHLTPDSPSAHPHAMFEF
jgi:isopenicillin-N N-acyltransferase-like protein